MVSTTVQRRICKYIGKSKISNEETRYIYLPCKEKDSYFLRDVNEEEKEANNEKSN